VSPVSPVTPGSDSLRLHNCGNCKYGHVAGVDGYGAVRIDCSAMPPESVEWDGYRSQMCAEDGHECPTWDSNEF
jgi:hypothetical protein